MPVKRTRARERKPLARITAQKPLPARRKSARPPKQEGFLTSEASHGDEQLLHSRRTSMTTQSRIGISRAIFPFAAVILFAMMTANIAEMQAKQPYDRDKLLRVVQLNALPTSE